MKIKSVKSMNPCESVIQTIIVKTHGGVLTGKSEVSKGTEFTVFLPNNS